MFIVATAANVEDHSHEQAGKTSKNEGKSDQLRNSRLEAHRMQKMVPPLIPPSSSSSPTGQPAPFTLMFSVHVETVSTNCNCKASTRKFSPEQRMSTNLRGERAAVAEEVHVRRARLAATDRETFIAVSKRVPHAFARIQAVCSPAKNLR